MNKKQKNTCILLVAISVVLVILIVLKLNVKKEKSFGYKLTFGIEESCTDKKLLYYDAKENINYYSYCIENIKIKEKTLSEVLSLKELTVSDFKKMKRNKKEKDYSIYFDREKEITVITCHSKDNKDVYIGNKDLNYKKDFCKNVTQDCYLVRTFIIKEIIRGKNESEIYIKSASQASIVKVSNSKLEDIQSGDKVQISFEGNNNFKTNEKIEDVFKRQIIEIVKIDTDENKIVCK